MAGPGFGPAAKIHGFLITIDAGDGKAARYGSLSIEGDSRLESGSSAAWRMIAAEAAELADRLYREGQ